jgi:hypothetical protein
VFVNIKIETRICCQYIAFIEFDIMTQFDDLPVEVVAIVMKYVNGSVYEWGGQLLIQKLALRCVSRRCELALRL